MQINNKERFGDEIEKVQCETTVLTLNGSSRLSISLYRTKFILIVDIAKKAFYTV